MYEPVPPFHETINKILYGILQYFKGTPLTMTIPAPPYYNVTNDLLYAILNTLNGSPVVYTQFRILYVSARYGNDGTAQVNNQKFPYKTITAAKNQAFNGDIIHVMEGIYDEGDLFGNYFYWFDYGAQINYSGNNAIFHQWIGTCIVRGYGRFTSSGNGSVINVGQWLFSVLDLECESIDAFDTAVIFWQNNFVGGGLYKPHKVKAKKVYANTGSAVHFRFNAYAEIEANEIISDSINQTSFRGTIFAGNINTGAVRNSRVIGNNIAPVHLGGAGIAFEIDNCKLDCKGSLPLAHGIYHDGHVDDLTITSTSIVCTSASSRSIYGQTNMNLHIDNNVNANVDTGGTGVLTYVNKENKINLRNNEVSIDITGNTLVDLSQCQNAELIFLTSSNAIETLSHIINAPKHHNLKIAPTPDLTVTVSGIDPSLADESSIILESASLTLKGNTGDWVELRNGLTGIGNRQVNASNY